MATAAAHATRRTLADLNIDFRSTRETDDFVLDVEYRVGRYGLRISRDGYGSRGVGGKLRHLVIAHVIREVKAGYNWRAYCGDTIDTRRPGGSERRAKMHAEHEAGKPWHYCRQPKVGEVVYCRQVCVDQNAVGRGAFDADGNHALDTDSINCNNCAVRFFGERPEPRAKVEAAARAERAEAKRRNPPPTCPHCGDVRPRTKATERGERPMCSTCNDATDRHTRYAYAAIHGKATPREGGYPLDKALAARLRDEAKAELARRDGMYFGR